MVVVRWRLLYSMALDRYCGGSSTAVLEWQQLHSRALQLYLDGGCRTLSLKLLVIGEPAVIAQRARNVKNVA